MRTLIFLKLPHRHFQLRNDLNSVPHSLIFPSVSLFSNSTLLEHAIVVAPLYKQFILCGGDGECIHNFCEETCYVRFEVLTVVIMKSPVVWVVTMLATYLRIFS